MSVIEMLDELESEISKYESRLNEDYFSMKVIDRKGYKGETIQEQLDSLKKAQKWLIRARYELEDAYCD